MITLIKTPTEHRLIRSKTKNQAIDFVVRGSIEARSVSADELVDLMQSGMVVEDADMAEEQAEATSERE